MDKHIIRYIVFPGLLIFASASWATEPVAVNIKRLTLDTALTIGLAAISECRRRGIHVGVVVMDRGGHTQVALRDTVATDLTLRIAPQKAYAALSFNAPTSELSSRANSPLGKLDGLVMAAGGLPIQAGGAMYGAIGVSGASSGDVDEACAAAGIDAAIDNLEMES